LSELSKILDPIDQEEVLTQIDELKRKFMEEFADFCGLLVTAKEKTNVCDLFDINLLRKYLQQTHTFLDMILSFIEYSQ
jgi:ADP-dependent phosphofructokinase/glucokinase